MRSLDSHLGIRGLSGGLLFLLASCDSTSTPTIDPAEGFGTPRSLVYVGSTAGAVVQGGAPAKHGVVFVYERDTFAPVGRFEVGDGPGEIRSTPDGSLVWVVNSKSNDVTLFDTGTWTASTVTVGVNPSHSFLTPAHDEVWFGNDGSSDVSILSLASRSVTHTVLTGVGHHKMAFATDDTGHLERTYVSNLVDGTITPVTANYGTETNVVGAGPAPHGMDYASTTTRVYNCSGSADNAIEVIATRDDPSTQSVDETSTIIARIPLPMRCEFLRVDAAGVYAHATLPDGGLLARVRLADNHVDTFAVVDAPDEFAVVGSTVFVVSSLTPYVSVVDETGVLPTTRIQVGNPVDPANPPPDAHHRLTLDGNDLFVPNTFDGTVSIIDVTTAQVVETLTGLTNPSGVAVAGGGSGTFYPR